MRKHASWKPFTPDEAEKLIFARANLRDGALTLTVTNPHLTEPREAEIAVRGAAVRTVAVTTLAAGDVHDHNTFEAPDRVTPVTGGSRPVTSPFVHRFSPASVTKLDLTLGG